MTREETIDAVHQYFAARSNVFAAVYLFGSFARDEARASSDIDLAVLCRVAPIGLARFDTRVADELSPVVRRRVDVIVANFVSPDLGHRIMRDGLIVAQFDRSARVAWEMKIRAEYFDVLPTLHRIRRTPVHLR